MGKPETYQRPDSAVQSDANPGWLVHVVIGFLLGAILISVWNLYAIRELSGLVRLQLSPSLDSQGIFLGTEGFGIGRLAPDVKVVSLQGEQLSFLSVAERHDVIYIASDTCPVCKYQFPELNEAAHSMDRKGGSFAIVAMINETSLSSLQAEYGFEFPIYQIEQESLLDLNLVATPTILLFRRAVLGDAFSSSTVEQMTRRVLNGLGS